MEALVTKASCQADKINTAKDQVVNKLVLMGEVFEVQRENIRGFFRKVWHIFVIGVPLTSYYPNFLLLFNGFC